MAETYLKGAAIAEARKILASALSEFKLEEDKIALSEPRDSSFGNLSSSICFEISSRNREKKFDPKQLAEDAAKGAKIRILASEDSLFSKIVTVNGYINFFYSDKFFIENLKQISSMQSKFGGNDSGMGKTAVVDYSSPNVGKPMHIGHIRSTIVGDSIVKILRFSSFKTVGSNYLCEAGLQTAKLLLAIKKFGKASSLKTEKDLLDYYVKIHKDMEKKKELEEEARKIVEAMESGEKATLALLKSVRKLSCAPFGRNYALLGIKFDETLFDSDLVEDGKKVVEEALKKKVAFLGNAEETVADLEKEKLPNFVILRSNGTTLYSTRDLALADSRFRKHHFDLCIYVTASEQNLHFRQVFALLKLLGRKYAPNLRHIGFGLISISEGKLSTREGRVLLLEDVLKEAVLAAEEEVKKRQDYDAATAKQISEKVGIAAIKYSILKVSNEKDITFSIKDSVRFDGNTAAYLQYTVVRAKSILRKAETEKEKTDNSANGSYQFKDEEKKLVSLLSSFPSVVKSASLQLSPHSVCDYLFSIATQFSSFYCACPVLSAETERAKAVRLQVVSATKTVLENGLALLGIEIPEKM